MANTMCVLWVTPVFLIGSSSIAQTTKKTIPYVKIQHIEIDQYLIRDKVIKGEIDENPNSNTREVQLVSKKNFRDL